MSLERLDWEWERAMPSYILLHTIDYTLHVKEAPRSGISIKGWRAWSYCCHVSLTLWQTSTALRPGKWGSDCPQHVGGENTDCYIGLDPHPSCPLLHNVRVPPCWTAHCQGQEPTSANGHFRRQIPFILLYSCPLSTDFWIQIQQVCLTLGWSSVVFALCLP